MDILTLNNELSKLKKQKNQNVQELGEKTWEFRISDSAYRDTYNQLEEIQGKIDSNQTHLNELNKTLQPLKIKRAELEKDFNSRIDNLKERRNATFSHYKLINNKKTCPNMEVREYL